MFSKKLWSLVSAAALMLAGGLAGTPASIAAPGNTEDGVVGKSKLSNSVYIVRVAEAPVVAYTGEIKGYQATKPKNGQKIDPDSPQVLNYKSYLESRHDAMLAGVGGGNKLYSYGYVFNGFAAELILTKLQSG